jgi:DNA helicase HerA-like ATPase
MRQLGIFPRKAPQQEQQDNALVMDVDEFDRGWPMMTLHHLCYVVTAVINLAEGKSDEEPQMQARGFQGQWQAIRPVIFGQFGGAGALADDDDDDGGPKKKGRAGPKFGDMRSWKVLSSRITRIRKLGVFDRAATDGTPLRYQDLLQPGRVNVIDLSDLENNDVRNLAIAEVLRGIVAFQQRLYDAATAKNEKPLATNIIIEEAHEFLSAKRIIKMPTLRDQLVKIAKRGRKRHLGLTFVTQSPNDLPDEVLGLVNNWIIYKIDDPIIRRIRSFVANADDSLWHLVRGLGQGQAVASFTHMKRPVITAMDPSPAMLRMTD